MTHNRAVSTGREPGIAAPAAAGRVVCLFVGDRPDPARFEPISMAQPRPLGKPQGGLWTCREVPGQPSAWTAWCQWTENTRFLKGKPTWRLTADRPRIFTIATGLGLSVARERYPHQPFPDWPGHVLGDEIDFAAMAEAYDAVELTASGLGELRFHDFMLYGWDVPTVLWLRWAFSEIEPL